MSIIHPVKVYDMHYDNTIELASDMIYYSCLLINNEKYKYKYRIKQIEWMVILLIEKYCKDNTIKISKIYRDKNLKMFFELLDEFKRKDLNALMFAKEAISLNKTLNSKI